jgi:uncharacterized protein YjbI with pentapeptide repeats
MTHGTTWTGPLEPEGDHELLELTDVDLGAQDGRQSRLDECSFLRAGLDGVRLDAAHLIDSRFEACHAGELFLVGASLTRVTFEGCRLGAVQAYDAELAHVTVRGGKLDYLNLRGARLREVLLEDCVLGDLDLGSAEVRRLTVRRCRIGRLDVTRASLTDTDLRGAELRAVDGLAGLAGATISEEQLVELAPALAAHVGLTVA